MKEYRCTHCNRLLLRGNYRGIIEIKCNKCKEMVIIKEEESR
ncbi:Com family DNA-binding transcriptional regulator [Bacillus toyonensis]